MHNRRKLLTLLAPGIGIAIGYVGATTRFARKRTAFAAEQPAPPDGVATVEARIGKLDFELAVPTKETVTNLYDAMDYQRACQLYLWALPIVGFANSPVTLEGTTGALPGDLAIYTGMEQSIFLTGNAITPYIVDYLDLAKTGPVVMDIPAGAIAGSAFGAWQRTITDSTVLWRAGHRLSSRISQRGHAPL